MTEKEREIEERLNALEREIADVQVAWSVLKFIGGVCVTIAALWAAFMNR